MKDPLIPVTSVSPLRQVEPFEPFFTLNVEYVFIPLAPFNPFICVFPKYPSRTIFYTKNILNWDCIYFYKLYCLIVLPSLTDVDKLVISNKLSHIKTP